MADVDKIDQLIAQAKTLKELGDAFVKATAELKAPATPGEDKFTQEELDAVLSKVENLKTALASLKT